MSASFDDGNLVPAAGLVPIMKLAEKAGLQKLAGERLGVPKDKGANAGLKVASLVGGMVAGADSIDDTGLLRHGGMGRLFTACYAPSTLGSFLRQFTFGHVRQLDAVATRFLAGLAAHSPVVAGIDGDEACRHYVVEQITWGDSLAPPRLPNRVLFAQIGFPLRITLQGSMPKMIKQGNL